VAEQFLHRADMAAGLEQVGCKAVPECMAACALNDDRLLDRQLHRTLHGFFMHMVSNRQPRIHVPAKGTGRKHVLPTPLLRQGWVFARERGRQRHTRLSRSALQPKAKVQFRKMHTQRIHNGRRQDRHTILTALCVVNDDLTALNHQILDPQAQRLHQPQAAAKKQIREEPRNTIKLSEHRTHFRRSQHHRQPFRAASPRNILEPGKINLQYLPV
jgi:hypothetical protein